MRSRLSSGARLSLPAIWHLDPIGSQTCPVGRSPFRVRGLAFVTLLSYIRNKTAGGLPAVLTELDGDPFRSYYDQLFIAAGLYDAAPLLKLMCTVAQLSNRDAGEFIRRRAWASARIDAEGTYRRMLSGASPQDLARRSPLAFNRYFEPCNAQLDAATDTSFIGVIEKVPRCMDGLYVFSTEGFVSGCLELAGARNVTMDWLASEPGVSLAGIATVTLRFEANWQN